MVALVTVFFVPEIIEIFGTSILFDSNFVKKVFWNAMKAREQSGKKRGDFIDSLIQLKKGEQSPDFSKYINKKFNDNDGSVKKV